MAYEREAIATSAIQNAPPQIMKEERVLDPYRVQGPTLKHTETGQQNTSRASAPQEETKVPHVETMTLSPAAAALARKEQKFRQQELEFKAKENALETERAELSELRSLKAKLANKDYSGIEAQVPYEDYTSYLLNKGQDLTPEQAAVQKLQTELEAVKKAQQDDVSKRFDYAVAERRKVVTELVDANPEFSSIKELNMQDAVVQHILDTWEHDSIDLSPEQAAKEVEELLIEKGNRWAALPKLRSTPVEDKKDLPPLKPSVQTLTNNMAPIGEIARPKRSYEGMSDSERYAEARRRAEEKIKANNA